MWGECQPRSRPGERTTVIHCVLQTCRRQRSSMSPSRQRYRIHPLDHLRYPGQSPLQIQEELANKQIELSLTAAGEEIRRDLNEYARKLGGKIKEYRADCKMRRRGNGRIKESWRRKTIGCGKSLMPSRQNLRDWGLSTRRRGLRRRRRRTTCCATSHISWVGCSRWRVVTLFVPDWH